MLTPKKCRAISEMITVFKRIFSKINNRYLGNYSTKIWCQKCVSQLNIPNIDIKQCAICSGVNSVICFNGHTRSVYRFSANGFGQIAIKRNYSFLLNNRHENIPLPLGIWENESNVVTAESLLDGTSIGVDDLDEHYSNILNSLQKLYTQNACKMPFSIEGWFKKYDYLATLYNQAWIERLKEISALIIGCDVAKASNNGHVVMTRLHGDLTFRNILNNRGIISLVDFDRSEMDFPEFDMYLLQLDARTHLLEPTYGRFFDYIISLINDSGTLPQMENFYSAYPIFRSNIKHEALLKRLFIYRMAVMILQVFNDSDKTPIRLLERIKHELHRASY